MPGLLSGLTSVTPFGALFVVSTLLMWWWSRRIAVSLGVDSSHIDMLVPLVIFTGIIGGAALTVLTPSDRLLAGDAMQTWLRIRLFGVFAAGSITVFIYSRLANFSFRSLLDILALPTIAAIAIHRVGCFLAGCCWGDISTHTAALDRLSQTPVALQVQTLPCLAGEWVSWAMHYPPGTFAFRQQVALGLIEASAPASLPVHPVQLYEAMMLVVMLLVVRGIPLNRYPRGIVAAYVAAGYAFIRFLLEFLRADASVVLGPLSMPQVHCIVVLSAVAIVLRFQSGSRYRALR